MSWRDSGRFEATAASNRITELPSVCCLLAGIIRTPFSRDRENRSHPITSSRIIAAACFRQLVHAVGLRLIVATLDRPIPVGVVFGTTVRDGVRIFRLLHNFSTPNSAKEADHTPAGITHSLDKITLSGRLSKLSVSFSRKVWRISFLNLTEQRAELETFPVTDCKLATIL